jgi:hypothetical protein
MTRIFLTGIAALFLATGAAHAIEYQGNLPKPVQKLPAYPPVVCVAPNWESEPCEDRQTPLPNPNPLRAFARKIPRLTTVLYYEHGGDVLEHWNRFLKLAGSGDDVEIRGACVSACTLIMAHIPSDRLCFGENASLQFHPSRSPKTGEPDISNGWGSTLWMINQYPQDIRLWIQNKGGWEKMALQQMWTLDASELWRMGYRKCEVGLPATLRPNPYPDALKNYRPQWKTAEEEEKEREQWREKDEKAEEAWKEWQRNREPNFEDAPWNRRSSNTDQNTTWGDIAADFLKPLWEFLRMLDQSSLATAEKYDEPHPWNGVWPKVLK